MEIILDHIILFFFSLFKETVFSKKFCNMASEISESFAYVKD